MAVCIPLLGLLACPAAWAKPRLCEDPWTYRIGSIDPRFGLSLDQAREVIKSAADIWGRIYSCDFFREDNNGAIVINFIYDERQAGLDTYRALENKAKLDRRSRDDLIALLKSQRDEYAQKRQALDNEWRTYNSRWMMLDVKTKLARMQTTVSEKDRAFLASENKALNATFQGLQAREQALKNDAAAMDRLEVLIKDLDNDARRFHALDNTPTSPMKIGTFEQYRRERTINIFLCPNERTLVRMIAHELGHALGLGHNDNPKAVMYYALKSDDLELAREDINDLKKLFRGFD